jgi:hypothetical protein
MFCTKTDKSAKIVIKRLPANCSSENVPAFIQEVDYGVISVKQISANSHSGSNVLHTSPSPSS